MLSLLKPFFGGRETVGRYPESLISRATARTLEGTDPRLSVLPGYRKKLRQPIIHAIDHIVNMVDSFPEPLETNSHNYGEQAQLRALFSSPTRMLELLATDINLNQFLREHPSHKGNIHCLLLAEYAARKVLGSELSGEKVRRDVVQQVAGFSEHRLAGFAVNKEKVRSERGSRAFNHLLALALDQISEAQETRQSLSRQRSLLQRKKRDLDRSGWGFETTQAGTATHNGSLEAELAEIEEKLKALGSSDRTLARHLEIICGVLDQAEQHLWIENMTLYLDRMNIVRKAEDRSARKLVFQVLRSSGGAQLVALPVIIPLDLLPARGNYLSEARKYL